MISLYRSIPLQISFTIKKEVKSGEVKKSGRNVATSCISINIGLYNKLAMSVSSFEVNAAAAMRDYYVEPRLGRNVGFGC